MLCLRLILFQSDSEFVGFLCAEDEFIAGFEGDVQPCIAFDVVHGAITCITHAPARKIKLLHFGSGDIRPRKFGEAGFKWPPAVKYTFGVDYCNQFCAVKQYDYHYQKQGQADESAVRHRFMGRRSAGKHLPVIAIEHQPDQCQQKGINKIDPARAELLRFGKLGVAHLCG